jgi:cell shape-determining protein MreC
MNPEINQEIQDLKKELKELKQLLNTLIAATDEGVTLSAESLIIKMLKNKIK